MRSLPGPASRCAPDETARFAPYGPGGLTPRLNPHCFGVSGYRSNTVRGRCPLIRITTDSGIRCLRARVRKLRRTSWNHRPSSFAAGVFPVLQPTRVGEGASEARAGFLTLWTIGSNETFVVTSAIRRGRRKCHRRWHQIAKLNGEVELRQDSLGAAFVGVLGSPLLAGHRVEAERSRTSEAAEPRLAGTIRTRACSQRSLIPSAPAWRRGQRTLGDMCSRSPQPRILFSRRPRIAASVRAQHHGDRRSRRPLRPG